MIAAMSRLVALSILLACACSSPAITTPDAGPADGGGNDAGDDAGAPGWTFETIDTRSVTVLEMPRTVELIRGHRPDGGRTYLLYVQSRVGAPLVVMNQPYDG